MEILNFAYCYDDKYNIQGEVSIISLLENIDQKINIYILHSKTKIEFLSYKITNHKNLNKIKIYYFDEDYISFPSIEKTHVSEATYYRLFLSKYIDEKIDYLIYLDADIICLNNPLQEIKNQLNLLQSNKLTIGAVVEHPYNIDNEEIKRLNLKSDYFNAGFLLINFQNWSKIESALILHMDEIKDKILLWDQDVMNSYFQNQFLKIPKNLNYFTSSKRLNKKDYKDMKKYSYFIHFSGKTKPWDIKGIKNIFTENYHQFYRLIYDDFYHIVLKYKRIDLRNLFFSLPFLIYLNYPMKYLRKVFNLFKN